MATRRQRDIRTAIHKGRPVPKLRTLRQLAGKPQQRKAPPHPMQPVILDEHGTARFKGNTLVRFLLDWATPRGMSLPELACLPNIPIEDHEQLAQLIGYSVNGFGELSYVSDETYTKAERALQKVLLETDKAKRVL